MLRKTLTIFSLIGLLLSVGAWGASLALETHFTLVSGLERERDEWPRTVCSIDAELSNGRISVLELCHADWLGEYAGCAELSFEYHARIPLWIPTLLFAGLSYIPVAPVYRRRKRKKLGLCIKCGYDLRGSKDRCPECGEEFGSTGVGRR